MSEPSIRDLLIGRGASILEALQHIEKGAAQIAFILDEDERLVGAVTDGDVRRGILRGIGLDAPVTAVMNPAPLTVPDDTSQEAALALMRAHSIHQLPVIDSERRVVSIITLDGVLRAARQSTTVVLMAGGLGSRLRPLTDHTPKPLLPIGGRPLLEITIENLARQGFGRFILSVNYRAEMFRAHFGEGQRLGVDIDYLHESERLGTAGALRLLPRQPEAPIIVMNGDILTNLDARRLVDFHKERNVAATMCVREYEWHIPYGVVRITADGHLAGFEEKPRRSEFVNAGIYVLSPPALDLVSGSGVLDMPTLFERVAVTFGPPAVYPLNAYWLDIGHLDDLQRAQDDLPRVFQ